MSGVAPRDEPIEDLIARSSIGDSAWIECPQHGHQPVDPFERERACVMCVTARYGLAGSDESRSDE